MDEIAICKICGNEMLKYVNSGGCKGKERLYCSSDCGDKHDRLKRTLQRNAKKNPNEKTNCKVCGNEFNKYSIIGNGFSKARSYCSPSCYATYKKTESAKLTKLKRGPIDKFEKKICKGCGKEMLKYFECGNHKALKEKVYCSRKCQQATLVKKQWEINKKNPEYIKAKSEYDKLYRAKNYEKRIASDREYYKNNREKILLSGKEYQRKNRKALNVVARNWEIRHPEKVREIKLLRVQFGTANLPIEVKKSYAYIHVGHRISRRGNIKKIELSDIKPIIGLVNDGDTHEAYK